MFQLQQYHIRNRLLAVLAQDDFVRLAPAFERVPLLLLETLFDSHRPLTHAYFVERGLISLVADTAEGRIEIGIIGREGMAGVPLVLGTDREAAMGIVQSPGEALRIPAEPLRAALDASPSLRGVLGRYIQSLVVQVGQTAYANAELTIEGRLARWILMAHDRLACDEMQLTHKVLAIMLGVRRPSVTMAAHTLEGAGMIRARRGHITVLDRERLEALAGDTYGLAEAEYERLIAEA